MSTHVECLVVGGGLSALFLGMLLEKAKYEFLILERFELSIASSGYGIALTPQIMPLLEQCGILDEVIQASKGVDMLKVTNNTNKAILHQVDLSLCQESFGHHARVIFRGALYNILRSRISTHKVVFGKEVVSIQQREQESEPTRRVQCECQDGTEYTAAVLVGGDGAYSVCRRLIFADLVQHDIEALTVNDRLPMQFSYHSLVGSTVQLSDEDYTRLTRDKDSKSGESNRSLLSTVTIGIGSLSSTGVPYEIWCMPMKGNRICWNIDEHLPAAENCPEVEDLTFDSVGVQGMLDRFNDVDCPLGQGIAQMRDLFELNAPNSVNRIKREEKIWDRWSHGRVVLIGDACHKCKPYGGQSAVAGFLDASVLVSELQRLDLKVASLDAISNAFQSYADQRQPVAREAVEFSKAVGEMLSHKRLSTKPGAKPSSTDANWVHFPPVHSILS